MLRDTVWVDETYINDTDLSGATGRPASGLSRQKLCICVAIDVHKNPVAVVCGQAGSPPGRRGAMGGRIAPGALLATTIERAHNALVGDGGLESEAHKAGVSRSVYLRADMVKMSVLSWLKRYLWRFTGMSPALQAYLDWYVYLFRVNQARDRWDPTARVVHHDGRRAAWDRCHPLSKLLE